MRGRRGGGGAVNEREARRRVSAVNEREARRRGAP